MLIVDTFQYFKNFIAYEGPTCIFMMIDINDMKPKEKSAK